MLIQSSNRLPGYKDQTWGQLLLKVINYIQLQLQNLELNSTLHLTVFTNVINLFPFLHKGN